LLFSNNDRVFSFLFEGVNFVGPREFEFACDEASGYLAFQVSGIITP